jgi:ribosomal protein S7
MHLDGYSWADIANELGFHSRQGAQTAVTRHLAETTPDPSYIARRKWIDGKRRLRARISRQLAAAETAGDHQAVAQLSAAIDRIDDQLAKASGYYAAQNVNVSVDTAPSSATAEWLRQVAAAAALVSGAGQSTALASASAAIDAEVIPS